MRYFSFCDEKWWDEFVLYISGGLLYGKEVERPAEFAGRRLDEVQPKKFHLTLFGGEPLLNLPVAYYLAERCHALREQRDALAAQRARLA